MKFTISCNIVLLVVYGLNVIFVDTADDPTVADHYKANWDSLESRPLPEWFDRDKFGIFIHWGVFAVPGRGEWFWSNWKIAKNPDDIQYMEYHYKLNFTYQEFAHDFTAEYFNATKWALIIAKSGARYTVLTSKHHEGYTLWPSKFSFSWNSVDVGPHKDIVGLFANAIREHTNVRFGLYHSLYEWFNPLYLSDKADNFTTDRFVRFKTLPELKELVNIYKPEIIWSDGEWEATDDYWKSKEFIAWLYNDSPVKKTVVVNDRWGSNTLCKHGGYMTCQDRFSPGKLENRKWENAMTIDKYTWGYRKNYFLSDFYTSQELIEQLVKTVSFGGNLLLNIAPNSDGVIPAIFQERLLDIGKWLDVNGEAIFETKPWQKCQNDTISSFVWYTQKPNIMYAIFLQWPESSRLYLSCTSALDIIAIQFLGYDFNITWYSRNDQTEIILPNKAYVSMNWAWALKITHQRRT